MQALYGIVQSMLGKKADSLAYTDLISLLNCQPEIQELYSSKLYYFDNFGFAIGTNQGEYFSDASFEFNSARVSKGWCATFPGNLMHDVSADDNFEMVKRKMGGDPTNVKSRTNGLSFKAVYQTNIYSIRFHFKRSVNSTRLLSTHVLKNELCCDWTDVL